MQDTQLKPLSIFVSAFYFGLISLFIAIDLHVILPFVKTMELQFSQYIMVLYLLLHLQG